MKRAQESLPPLDSLIEVLGLIVAQARTYELILPPDNYQARAAVTVLGELARKALNEAESIAEALCPPETVQSPFSPRELEVLKLAAHGMTNREIAHRLAISERTVQFHMNSIFNKSGAYSRTEAVAMALRNQWITNQGS